MFSQRFFGGTNEICHGRNKDCSAHNLFHRHIAIGFFRWCEQLKLNSVYLTTFLLSMTLDSRQLPNLSLNTFSPFCRHLFDSLKHSFLDIFSPIMLFNLHFIMRNFVQEAFIIYIMRNNTSF